MSRQAGHLVCCCAAPGRPPICAKFSRRGSRFSLQGLKDHSLRFGIDIGAQWDARIPLLHPDDQEESRKAWSTCLRTGEAAEFSQRVRNPQGGYRWFLTRVEPLRASDGTLLQWVGVNLDIEELMRAQEALRESERRSRSAIDGIAGLVAVLAPNGELETVNRQCLEYFGRSLE